MNKRGVPIIVENSGIAEHSDGQLAPNIVGQGFHGNEYHSDAFVRDQLNYQPAHINLRRSDTNSSQGYSPKANN